MSQNRVKQTEQSHMFASSVTAAAWHSHSTRFIDCLLFLASCCHRFCHSCCSFCSALLLRTECVPCIAPSSPSFFLLPLSLSLSLLPSCQTTIKQLKEQQRQATDTSLRRMEQRIALEQGIHSGQRNEKTGKEVLRSSREPTRLKS